jgi:hypothetical protein
MLSGQIIPGHIINQRGKAGTGIESPPPLTTIPVREILPAVVPVVMMPVVPTVVAPVVVVPTVMPVPSPVSVMPADLFGLETIDFVLRHDRGLRACTRQYQTLLRRNRR